MKSWLGCGGGVPGWGGRGGPPPHPRPAHPEGVGRLTADAYSNTGDKRQKTGDIRQDTRNRRQETGDNRLETTDRRKRTGDNRLETTDRRQET